MHLKDSLALNKELLGPKEFISLWPDKLSTVVSFLGPAYAWHQTLVQVSLKLNEERHANITVWFSRKSFARLEPASVFDRVFKAWFDLVHFKLNASLSTCSFLRVYNEWREFHKSSRQVANGFSLTASNEFSLPHLLEQMRKKVEPISNKEIWQPWVTLVLKFWIIKNYENGTFQRHSRSPLVLSQNS